MSEIPQTAADSWCEAADWLEDLLAEGDQSLRFLRGVIELVSAHEYYGQLWAHPLSWGLALSLSHDLEEGPCLLIWSDDEWPYYDIELRDHLDRRLFGWFCDGEEEMESALAEAVGELQRLRMGSRS